MSTILREPFTEGQVATRRDLMREAGDIAQTVERATVRARLLAQHAHQADLHPGRLEDITSTLASVRELVRREEDRLVDAYADALRRVEGRRA